ncbi:MAG TPA: FAD-dependent oxidoreductase, partial [Bdellovibrionota bacterium]|nr:FAD-dependent oxidoreductase [Bdellovibrionota bacterium]
AGAAGLAAARRLDQAGISHMVIEARNRVGGRIHSCEGAELGAEFIHDEPEGLLALAREAGVEPYELADRHLLWKGGRLVEIPDFWGKLIASLDALDPDHEPDRPVAEALAEGVSDPEWRELARSYIEGFHAADPRLAGEREIARAEREEGADRKVFRIREGYSSVLEPLMPGSTGRGLLLLSSRLLKLRWRAGSVEAILAREVEPHYSRIETAHANAAIVTFPLGVLQASARKLPGNPRFDPELPSTVRTALSQLRMGTVLKVVFRFTEAFWESDPRMRELGFVHAPELAFPTWWGTRPEPSPKLVAWLGGPEANRLSVTKDPIAIQRLALSSLEAWSGVSRNDIRDRLSAWYFHDWRRDPLSLGAYAYAGVGSEGAAETLAEPVEDTMFFAGEAVNPGGATGTVDAAIASGEAAAARAIETIAKGGGQEAA